MKQDERPRYVQIVDELRAQIESHQLDVGALLPSESDLRERFLVSRHTIREALRTLKEEGLIQSRQGAGSRVTRSSRPVYTHAVASVAELLQYATEARYSIDKSAVIAADKDLVEKIGGELDWRWLRVEGFRFLKDSTVPLCWTEVFVLSDYSGVGVLIGRQSGTIYSAIEAMYKVKIDRVEQTIYVDEIPPVAAEGLRIKDERKSIVIRRVYLLSDNTIPMVSVNYHAIDQFRLNWTLQRAPS
ncbi:GntR family transcriptional regulator [Aminobacter sp. MSH1]|uniref:GntR family transcriptional regulator n=1 Tax=Aminobacter sp. MSH1 TaxID=374606 RepID=UPI000D39876B|nr:GntR family transcriptional regulator [Aminobacter sp. MSH1]